MTSMTASYAVAVILAFCNKIVTYLGVLQIDRIISLLADRKFEILGCKQVKSNQPEVQLSVGTFFLCPCIFNRLHLPGKRLGNLFKLTLNAVAFFRVKNSTFPPGEFGQ